MGGIILKIFCISGFCLFLICFYCFIMTKLKREDDNYIGAIVGTLGFGIAFLIAISAYYVIKNDNNPPEKIEQYGQTYVLQTETPSATTEINGHTYVLVE